MEFIESRLTGVRIDKTGREASLSITQRNGSELTLNLHGVEKLLINELRQQNIIEEVTHWTNEIPKNKLREAASYLVTGGICKDEGSELMIAVDQLVHKVVNGEIEMLEITAIFGAQILASFASITIKSSN